MSETEGNACITLYQNPAHALVESERHALRQATGGNPLAIRLLLGRLQLSGQSVAQVLALSRSHRDWDLGQLVETSWAALTEDERTVLIALTFFAPDAADDALAEGLMSSQCATVLKGEQAF